jgi:predicted acylesterase/phospholipase RssA
VKTRLERLIRPFLALCGNVAFAVSWQTSGLWTFLLITIGILNAPTPAWYDTRAFAGARKRLAMLKDAVGGQRAHVNTQHAHRPQKKRRKPRVGLVLSGGGGKGAYEIGVLQVLTSRGITFDAIAGTSIGAFNAALFVNHGPVLAEQKWNEINTWQVAKAGLSIGRLLSWPLTLSVNLVRLCFAHVPRAYSPMVRRGQIYVGLSSIAQMVFLGLLAPSLRLPTTIPTENALAWMGLFAITYFSVPLWNRLNPAFFSPESLTRFVASAIDTSKTAGKNPSVFVTIASLERMVNEGDSETFRRLRDEGHNPAELDRLIDEVSGSVELVPRYIELSDLPPVATAEFLAASMALPVGIVPAMRLRRRLCVDGGRADNTPLLPLLAVGCNVIFVVHLTPGAVGEAATRQLLKKAMHIQGQYAQSGDGGIIAGRHTFAAKTKGVRIIHIRPLKRLGLPFLSTLDFSPRRLREHFDAGVADAARVLKGLRTGSRTGPN